MDKGVLVTDKAINEIISQCHDVRADWWHLGISLGVLYSTLEAIEARHKGDVDRCLSVLISTWLRRAKGEVKENVRPTWKSLCESLSYINVPLAETIAREHGCGYINPIVSKVAAGAPGADPPTFLPQSCGCGQCTVKGWAALGSGVCQNVYHDRRLLLLVVDRCSPQVRFEESYDRKAKLCAETSKITDLFASVCLKTWMCLRNIDNHKVAKLGFKLSAWLGRSFPMISNIFKLQAFMHSLGISWFNYEPLHFLAKETLDSGLISSWDNYIDCFTYYCSERNLKEYANVFFQTEQQHVFLLEVDECYSQFTLSDIKDLRKSLSTALKIPFVSLHLVTVRTGSLFIYFHYGYTDYLMMFQSLSSQQLREIASIKGYRILSLVDFYDQFKYKNIQKYCHLKEAVPKSEEQLSTSVTDTCNSSGGHGGFCGRNRDNEDGESRGGFGRGRENGDDNGGRRGFGRRDQKREGGSRGFGKSGGGFGRRRDNDGKSGGGFGGRRNRDNNQEGGFGRGDGDREDRPREVYVPPLPTDDEDTLYQTISAGINFDRYDEIPVEVTGRDAPAHINSFEECGFFDTTKENIRKCKYKRPTPVQKYAIPIGMSGRDLMACAQTGSGKTAAFLLPSITRLIKENVPGATRDDSQSPQVLIISPTRELTSQIYDEARKFTRGSIYRPVVCYGGTSVGHQLRQIEGGCNILVCTPGRLMDFLRRKKVLLDQLKTFILDEADRMLDMGFGEDIRSIVEEFDMPPKTERQTLMFSATFPEEIQQLAAKYLDDYVFLTVGRVGGATTDITQSVVDVGEYEKREKLVEILKTQVSFIVASDRTLVFVETKRNADFLASFLSQEGFPTTSIHGDRFQREREEALRDFRSGRAPVLVATSVAARGLDIPEVKHVVNYDLPKSIEEYVHRIGCTGRIGNKGLASTAFFQKDKDAALASSLVKILGDAEQDVPDFLEQAAEEATGTTMDHKEDSLPPKTSEYDEIPVEVTGRDAPAHINSFEECGFFDTTKKNIKKCKYKRPTPVQKYAIPIGMGGHDLVACAQTGSGKTAAFLLPSITRLIKENVPGATRDDSQSPQVLIISPTRELTSQIYDEARKFTRGSIYRPVVCYGGTSVGHQLRQIEGGCNILVCTPGRLMDFLRRKKVLLDQLKTFILDEADRMLDMGFGGDIRSIVEEFDMPPKTERQTLMFSATFPEEIQQLAAKYLNDYVFLTVGRVGGATTDITQSVVDVGEYEKREKLVEILKTQASDRTLVFVETKKNADFLASFLSQEGFPTTSIHGDRFHREREEALRDFRSGRAPVLVVTSVAARGLDIPEVKHVVNYDLPKSIEEYVHRIGRTGRIGNKGLATAFFKKDKDAALARSLVKILGDAEQDVPDFLEQAAEEATGTNYGPQGGQFASKNIRSRGGGGGGGFTKGGGGWGESSGGFDNDEGFSNNAAAQEDEEWD